MGPVRRLAVLVSLVLGVAPGALAQTVVVSPGDLEGWTLVASSGTGDEPPPQTYLAPGYETPPAGDGSLHLNVGENGNDASQARTNAFAGTRIADITALSYSTFTNVDVTGSAGDQAPYLIFHVDTDGDLGTADVQLWFFEPAYQSTPPTVDQWQSWDAHAGGWYTQGGLAGSGPGANVKTFAQLLAVAPNATIVSSGTGGVRIVTGFGAGAWDFYAGAADELRFATASSDVTYDFEPDGTTLVTVTPSELENWTLTTVDEGAPGGSPSATIVSGPDTPPQPPGSLRLAAGTDGADAAEARSDRWDGLYLRDLAALSYSTHHESGGSGGQLPYLILRVDYDSDGDQDDLLFFEPDYQSAGFCGSNPQPATATGTWQTWEAAEGCWWSLNTTAGAGPGTDVKPLSVILAAQPDARMVTGATGGSFRVVAGFGAGAWDSFIGFADELRVLFDPETDTTYDFDPDPTITITGDSTLEPDAGTAPLTFGVTLSHAVSHSVTVEYDTANGTATVADGDYAPESGTVTFTPGDTSESIVVDVNGDLKLEADESMFVDLSNPSGATIATAQGEGVIGNDDPQPQVSIANATLDEGDAGSTTFNFNVTLSNPSVQTITVDYATGDGTAVDPPDYGTATGTVTFDPGETLQTISVSVNGDTTFEDGETFTVTLSDPANATIDDGEATGTITNDDAHPEVSIGDESLAEGDSGTTDFTFTVELSNASEQTVTVDFDTADGSASAPDDYTAATGTVTFAPGVTAQTVTVAAIGDDTTEGDETFFVDLSDPTNATIDDGQGAGTIENDDAQPTITIGDRTRPEGDSGTTDYPFNVKLSNPSAFTVTVDYTTTNDTATAPSDFTAQSGTVTFDPGQVSRTVTIVGNGDLVGEADERFFVDLDNPSGATIADGQGRGIIQDDDGRPTLSFAADVTLEEGSTAGTPTPFTFLVTLSHPSQDQVRVECSTTTGGTASADDFDDESASLIFEPGQTQQPCTVEVTPDVFLEPDETFVVILRWEAGATIGDGTAVGTIVNDDVMTTVSIEDGRVVEGDSGQVEVELDVVLSREPDMPVTVFWSTANDTATSPADYLGQFNRDLHFNSPGLRRTIRIPVIGDLAFEPDETFFVNIDSVENAAIADGQAVATIENDDGPPTISIEDVSKLEGSGPNSVVFEVTLSQASGLPVTVDFATAPGTAGPLSGSPGPLADYQSTSGTLTFAPGTTSRFVQVMVHGDPFFEPDETFFVNLSDPSGATIADGQGTGTILNDDTLPTISINDVSEPENSGTFTFTLTLSHPIQAPVGVQFETADGSAEGPGDYVPRSGSVVFTPMDDGTQTIEIEVTDDGTFEGDETFFVNLSNAGGATIADGEGEGTIEDDEAPPTIAISDVELNEGDSGFTEFEFEVTLSGPSAMPVTVDFETLDSGASAPSDFVAASGTVTFEPGQMSRSIIVQVVGDTVLEFGELFAVRLSNAVGGTIGDDAGAGSIVNDDEVPAVSINDVTQAEGDGGTTSFTFTLSLSGPSQDPVEVDFATANGSAAAPGDYVPAAGRVTITPGALQHLVTVEVTGDTAGEIDETFFVDLSSPTGATIADDRGVGTIVNDDAEPAIIIGNVTETEGDLGTKAFVFEVVLSGPSADPVTVDFATAPGTASHVSASPGPVADFMSTSGTLTFAPGETSGRIAVTVFGDSFHEGFESFFVNLSNPSGGTIADGQGAGLIVDDDGLPSVSIGDVSEPESGTFTFTVTVSGPRENPVSVGYFTEDGTAVAPGDYTAESGTVIILPDENQQTITISVVNDSEAEPDETFLVQLANAVNLVIVDGEGLGTILNDDGAEPGVADLTVTKTGPGSVEPGAPLEYLIAVRNLGPEAATNVVVTDTLPAGTTFVSANPSQGSCSGTTTITCSLGTIDNGSSATIELVVTAPATQGEISNTATADADQTDATAAAATANTFVVGGAGHVAGIPTLSEWALMLMLMGLAAAAAGRLRA